MEQILILIGTFHSNKKNTDSNNNLESNDNLHSNDKINNNNNSTCILSKIC